MRLHYENLEKLLYCKSKIFPVIFATVKLRLYCRKDVFFEQFLVLRIFQSFTLTKIIFFILSTEFSQTREIFDYSKPTTSSLSTSQKME